MKRSLLFFVLATLIFVGCGTTKFMVGVQRPAEINLSKFKKIAIGEITGSNSETNQAARDISDELTTALSESQRFEVLDRQNLDKVMQEAKMSNQSTFDEASAAKLGQLVGAAAMIFGRVSEYKYKEETSKNDPYTDKQGKFHQWYFRTGVTSATVNFKITDLVTGKIIVSKNISASFRGETSADNEAPPAIDRDPLFASSRRNIINDFMKKIAPYTENIEMFLFTDSDLPELEKGVNQVKAGNWDSAIELFKESVEKHQAVKTIYKAYYNLGVSYMYNQKFKEALDTLNKGYALNNDKDILTAIQDCKTMEAQYKKLQEQLQ